MFGERPFDRGDPAGGPFTEPELVDIERFGMDLPAAHRRSSRRYVFTGRVVNIPTRVNECPCRSVACTRTEYSAPGFRSGSDAVHVAPPGTTRCTILR